MHTTAIRIMLRLHITALYIMLCSHFTASYIMLRLHATAIDVVLQADTGAQVVQIFDSWASELSPQDFDVFSAPYIKQIVDTVRKSHPDLVLILYISGSGGLLERMTIPQPDIISVDQRVGLQDAIRRIGPSFAVQVPPAHVWSVTAFIHAVAEVL